MPAPPPQVRHRTSGVLGARGYLFLSLALVTVAPILVLGFYQSGRFRASEIEQSDRQHSIAARAVSDRLSEVLAANTDGVEVVARQLTLLDTVDPAVAQPILDAERHDRPTVMIWVADATVTSTAASPTMMNGRRSAGKYYGDRQYVRDALATGQVSVSPVEVGRSTGVPNLHVAAVMRRKDGSLLGLTGAAVDLTTIEEAAIRSAAIVPGLRLLVVDSTGHVLIHPDRGKAKTMTDLGGLALVRPAADTSVAPEIREAVDDGGTRVRAAVVTMHGKASWTVAVYRPVAAVEAEANATVDALIAWIVAILLGSFLLSAIVASWLAAPLVRLAGFVARPSEAGDRVFQPRRGEPREIADLLVATRSMMARLNAQTTELEAQVAQRTGELLEAQTTLARAERLTSLGTLTAGLAHEINNPLTYVVASLEHVRATVPALAGEDGERRLEAVLSALDDAAGGAERIRLLVDDLKGYSRRDDGRLAPVEVGAAIEHARKLGAVHVKHRASLVTALAAVPVVHANEARLVQVLLNLIVNAAQAMPEGSLEANQITLTTSVGADARVAIAVRDNGCGIAPEHLGRLFDPFFTTKPVGEGTGLGLFICHNLVTSMGGELLVESRQGEGSTFTIWLRPATELPAAPLPVVAAPARVARCSVLVIDDDPVIGKIIVRYLTADTDVTYLRSAREALARIGAGDHFDAILCDLMMPDIDGPLFYEQLTAVAPAMATRTAFITGGASTPRTAAFLEALPHRALAKPFSRAPLLECVAKLAATGP